MSTFPKAWATAGGVVRSFSLSRVQSVVATLAGIASVAGASLSLVQFARPANTGEFITTVYAAGSNRTVPDATVEVLTIENVLVATLTPDSEGQVSQELKEGMYVVRVSHPRYAADVRRIQVQPQQTIQIKTTLRSASSAARTTSSSPRPDSSSSPAGSASLADRAVDKGVDAALKKFGF